MKEITLAAKLENIPVVTDFIEEALDAVDGQMKAKLQIDVAIDELFNNISSYAYPGGGGEATVQFSFDEAERMAAITFIDSGIPFNPLKAGEPDINLPVELRGVGGLGIMLVKKTMDDMRYERVGEKNILTIYKRV